MLRPSVYTRVHVKLPKFSQLSEAVSSGFTFTMLTDQNVGMHTPFQCKDYFQDMFWVEYNEKAAEVCGFPWVPGGIDKSRKTFTMALAYKESLALRRAGLEAFVNHFDDALGFQQTVIEETDHPNILRMVFDGRWTHSAPLVSSFTSIIRLGFTFKDGDDPKEYMENVQKQGMIWRNTYKPDQMAFYSEVNLADFGRMNETKPRFLKLLDGFNPKWDYKKIPTANAAHCFGVRGSTEEIWT